MNKLNLVIKTMFVAIICGIMFSCGGGTRGGGNDNSLKEHADIYGVSFQYPSGWEVSKTEEFGAIKYISIEKKGLASSGLVTMSFTEEDYELDEYLQLFQESLLAQKNLKNMVFQKANEACYGKYKGIVSSYTFETLSIKHEGKMYIFNENGTTMCLIEQEAVEDHKKNLRGFEAIRESLSF